MSWYAAIPVVAASAAWLFVPGLLACYAVGLRGVAAFGIAPIVSTAALSTTAVFADMVGVDWTWPLAAGVVLAEIALTAGIAHLVRRRFPAAAVHRRDPLRFLIGAAVGSLAAFIMGVCTIVPAFDRPDTLSQTYDAVFHYSAVAYILDSGNASALTIGALGAHDGAAFYPAAWHDFVSLTALSTGTSVPAAANMLTFCIAALVWPASCLLLCRQLFGRYLPAMVLTGILSVSFVAFPWGLMSFGVVWPNVLGISMIPAALAILTSILGLAKQDAIGPVLAWILTPITLVAALLAHPNTLFTIAGVSLFPVFATLGRRSLRLRRQGRALRGAAEFGAALILTVAAWRITSTSGALAPIRNKPWPPFENRAQSIGEILILGTNARTELWLLSFVVMIGLVASWRSRRRNWLIAGIALFSWLYMMAAAVPELYKRKFTGYWYNDSQRIAATFMVLMTPLAVCGITVVALRIFRVVRSRYSATGSGPLRRVFSPTGIAVVLTVALLFGTDFFYRDLRVTVVNEAYRIGAGSNLADQRKQAFLKRAAEVLPADATVANNPWNGSTLLWPLADRRPMFGHLAPSWGDDRTYLALHLVDAGTDPKVCQAANRLKVKYMMTAPPSYWPQMPETKDYPGITDPGTKPGFTLLAADGDLKLFKISAC